MRKYTRGHKLTMDGLENLNDLDPTLDMVREFHTLYEVGHLPEPGFPDLQTRRLRVSLIREELREFKDAIQDGDIVEVLDALCDLQYVLDGAFMSFGLTKVKMDAMREVHRSNLSKLGPDGKPVRRSDGKIIKGPNYSPPDLTRFVSKVDPIRDKPRSSGRGKDNIDGEM